jgi:hypothetical protein
MSAGIGSAHRRNGCSLVTFSDLLTVIVGTHRGFCRFLIDNRVQLAPPALQSNFICEGQLNLFRM